MSQLQSHRSLVALPKQPSQPGEPRPFEHNLPAPPTPLIGREHEIAAVVEMLCRPDVHLLTLIGPPGIGKTRLGIRVTAGLLDYFENGVYFVDLAPITDYTLVIPTIARTLGIRQAAHQTLLQALQISLSDKVILLLLDNFEQVLQAAPSLAELLQSAPGVKILATSREMLHLSAEHDFLVPPLSIPPISALVSTAQAPSLLPHLSERVAEYETVQLFTQRALALKPDFALTEENALVVSEICRRLDGLPLAIELAAARVRHLPLKGILNRLESKLQLLTGGAHDLPARQQTLRAAIEWSYDLLREEEKKLFRRLGVFTGGCSLEAAGAVCNAEAELSNVLDGVASLVDKSLLQQKEGVEGEPRFMMLEMIREFSLERLEEHGEAEQMRKVHADFFLKFAEGAEAGTWGSNPTPWMERLDQELDNLRAVLAWSQSTAGGAEIGLRIAGALRKFWEVRGYFTEVRERLAALLSLPEAKKPTVARALALSAAARTVWAQADFAEAHSLYQESLAIGRELGDKQAMTSSLNGLGLVALWQGDYVAARDYHQECLTIARELGDKGAIAGQLGNLGIAISCLGDHDAARSLNEEALALYRELGDKDGITNAARSLGATLLRAGNYNEARALLEARTLLEESVSLLVEEVGDERSLIGSLNILALIVYHQGDYDRAEALYKDALKRARGLGTRQWMGVGLIGLAELARVRGQPERAARLFGASRALYDAVRFHDPFGLDRTRLDAGVSDVRAMLDEASFAAAWAEARAMSLEQAIAYALEPSLEQMHAPNRSSASPVGALAAPAVIPPPNAVPQANPDADDLTEREVEVLRRIAAGKSNQEIASELVLSLRTVERHISNIYQKIGAHGKAARVSASAYAAKYGVTGG